MTDIPWWLQWLFLAVLGAVAVLLVWHPTITRWFARLRGGPAAGWASMPQARPRQSPEEQKRRVYAFDTGVTDWVVAYDITQAMAHWTAHEIDCIGAAELLEILKDEGLRISELPDEKWNEMDFSDDSGKKCTLRQLLSQYPKTPAVVASSEF